MSKVIIDGEYAYHRCDFCGLEKRGTPWTTHGPGFDSRSTWSEDSSTAPVGWTHLDMPYKTGSATRRHRCDTCTLHNIIKLKES